MSDYDKHSSLLQNGTYYGRKIFILLAQKILLLGKSYKNCIIVVYTIE